MEPRTTVNPLIPIEFKPPVVMRKTEGLDAFYAYDWYFSWMKQFMSGLEKVFLTPCAATKPIHSSTLHRYIYQKFIQFFLSPWCLPKRRAAGKYCFWGIKNESKMADVCRLYLEVLGQEFLYPRFPANTQAFSE